MAKYVKLALLLIFSVGLFGFKPSQKGNIIVDIEKFDSNNGKVIVHLYNKPDKFPTEPGYAFRRQESKIRGKKAHVEFKDIPYGAYAITIHHDENNNGKMDTNFLGIPNEGYGFSMNPTVITAPPDFDESQFEVEKSETKIRIEVKG